jgi:hypothetical protein
MGSAQDTLGILPREPAPADQCPNPKSRFYGALPELADEIEALLRATGEADLAAQVHDLDIVDRCRCKDDFCSTFCVQPKPPGAYGPGHRNVVLSPETGMLIFDVVDEKIGCVEVLYRDDVQGKLQAALPWAD